MNYDCRPCVNLDNDWLTRFPMKKLLPFITSAALCFVGFSALLPASAQAQAAAASQTNTAPSAALPSAEPSTAVADKIRAILAKIQAKMQPGPQDEKVFADELKAIDDLYAQYKTDQSEDAAQILVFKAIVYMQLFNNTDKALAIFKQIKTDLPNTATAKEMDEAISQLQRQADSDKIQKSLVVGAKFPDFAVKDLDGKPLSLANEKGKVVLVDFWATWCGPCVMEMPNVIAAYNKYHAKGFDIIGISLDDKDKAPLLDYIKTNKMPWPQFYDGKRWDNELAVKYGIMGIPASYLLDGTGAIIAVSPRGPALDPAIAAALAKK